MPQAIVYRPAAPEDALSLSALATQVFLDTYATNGVDIALAKEVGSAYSRGVFEQRLSRPGVELTVASRGDHLLAFLDLDASTTCPVPAIDGLEVLRLYVQGPFQRRGVGQHLMSIAERQALARGAPFVWLTAWSGNARALAFYRSLGYRDVGATAYVMEGQAYENRVLAKRCVQGAT